MRSFKITNRSGGWVVYTLPEMNNLNREFAPGETKTINEDELRMLNFLPGGRALLFHYLMIESDEALADLEMKPEREYYMSEKDVAELVKSGSMNEFLDALDFAPEGVIDLIKDYAVKLPCNDVAKRAAILEKTGFDVTKAIENLNAKDDSAAPEAPKRRVNDADVAAEQPKRRQQFKIGTPATTEN